MLDSTNSCYSPKKQCSLKNNCYTYPYAISEDGKPVYIEKITKENRHDYHYHCYGCGAELFPVLGEKRAHHFRHEKGCTCNPDKYLHEFAKATIKKQFDENDKFVVKYHAHQKCKKADECELNKQYHWPECENDGLYAIDLKQFYDTCTFEQGYYQELPEGKKRYIADLFLSHSKKPENKQICIEIWVTHECTDEKKQNGGRIIEIKISKESDAFREIIECDDENLPIRFFNFKHNVRTEPSHKLKHIKIINNNNHLEKINTESICSDGFIFDEKSFYEIILECGMDELEENKLFAVLCNKSNPGIIRNHSLCRAGYSIYGRPRCRLRKIECPCQDFIYDERKGTQILEKYKDVPFWEKE